MLKAFDVFHHTFDLYFQFPVVATTTMTTAASTFSYFMKFLSLFLSLSEAELVTAMSTTPSIG